jgi:hypothetical protein
MPKSAYQENNEGIPYRYPYTTPTTAQWYIYVISKPGCQGDMPPAPKFRYITRKIRIPEIIHQTNTKQARSTYGNI